MKQSIENLHRPAQRTAALLMAAAILAGCSSKATDTNGVDCDGKKVEASFEDKNRITFFAQDENETNTLAITINRAGEDQYAYEAKPVTATDPQAIKVIGAIATDGRADPDYSVEYHGTVWGVDVDPEAPSVLISGYCSNDQ